jgi:hypothetical protein
MSTCGFCGGSGRRGGGSSSGNATRSGSSSGTKVASEKNSNGIPQFAFWIAVLFTAFVLWVMNEDGGMDLEGSIWLGGATFIVSFVAVIVLCYVLIAVFEILKVLIGVAVVLIIIAIIAVAISDAEADTISERMSDHHTVFMVQSTTSAQNGINPVSTLVGNVSPQTKSNREIF